MAKCKTKRCRNYVKSGEYCSKCKSRKYRENNPERCVYLNLKSNAKRRGKEFDISFDDFLKFAIDTDYFKKRGIKKKSLHIDRIDESRGYTIDNIQTLTNSNNVKKYLRYRYDEYERKMIFNTKTFK